MTRPAELDCKRTLEPVPLAHLLSCEECAERVTEQAREANPGMRLDLFPGDDCPDDDVLAGLARERPCSPEWEHVRQCLWCALSARHFASTPDACPSPLRPLQQIYFRRFRDIIAAQIGRPLPPSAEIDYHGDSLSVRTPLDRRARAIPFNPDLPVRRLIPTLITRQELPFCAPDGTPLRYSLEWKDGGRRLEEHETLTGAGVKEGDRVYLVPEIMAPIPRA